MIKFPNLLPECNVDTAFVEMLGYKEPNHVVGITQVSAVLQNQFLNSRAMGFIDNDKRKTEYIKQFNLIEELNSVKLLKHPDRFHFLVVVNPAMDGFIFNLAQNLEINLSKYRFPIEFAYFKALTKKEAIKNNQYFKNLLNTIMQKSPPEIVRIKSWIRTHSPYNN